MGLSFIEKSVWIQLVGMLVVLGGYFVVAGIMMANGVTATQPYIPLFAVSVVLMTIVLVAGHTLAAVTGKPEGSDERDRLIGWRSEANASWIVGVGVILATTGLVFGMERVWVAHLLLLSLFISETVKYTFQLVYYRRGF